jgi:hypothetical protein
LTIVLPRSTGTFLIARSLISLNGSAVSRMARIWARAQVLEADQVLAEERGAGSCRLRGRARARRRAGRRAPARAPRRPGPAATSRCAADDVGLDRQLAAAAVDEHAQPDARGRPKSASSSSAARAVRPVYSTSSTMTRLRPSTPPGGSRVSPSTGRADGRQVVAVQRDVEGADGGRWPSARSISARSLRQLDAAPLDAHEAEALHAVVVLDDLARHARQRALDGALIHQQAGARDSP